MLLLEGKREEGYCLGSSQEKSEGRDGGCMHQALRKSGVNTELQWLLRGCIVLLFFVVKMHQPVLNFNADVAFSQK